jgi:hypothetical protein
VKQPRTTTMRLVAAATGALLLSGCSGAAPGVAADVDGHRITDDQVDAFADVLCAIGGVQGTDAGVPAKSARFQSLQILVNNQLAEEVADPEAVSQQAVASILENLSQARDSLTEDQQDTFDQVAEDFARAQTALVDLGRQSLEKQGKQGDIADDAAFAEGQRLLVKYADQADIEIDPRFGRLVDGALQPANGSLSVPVSDLAVQGDAAQPGDGLVGQLPASQKCAAPS